MRSLGRNQAQLKGWARTDFQHTALQRVDDTSITPPWPASSQYFSKEPEKGRPEGKARGRSEKIPGRKGAL